MPSPGANLTFQGAGSIGSYGRQSFLWEVFLRKLGCKARSLRISNPTNLRNCATDLGTTFPRQIAICAKYDANTAPASNTAADAPTGIGDICIHFKANNTGSAHILYSNIDVYRCTVYASTSSFTWAKIF